jgi:phosphatidylglycerophosphate synthase
MRNLLNTIPNQLTALRLAFIPGLWAFAWFNKPAYIGYGVLFCFITDVLDGFIARKLNQVSENGAKFDSFADNLFLPSTLVWLWMFRKEIFTQNWLLITISIIAYFASILLGMIKSRQFGNTHLYSSKIAAVAEYSFASHALIAAQYNQPFFVITAILFIFSSVEDVALRLYSDQVNEHMGSLFLVWRYNHNKKSENK